MNKKKIILISVVVFIVVSLIITAIVLTNYKEFDVQYDSKTNQITITYRGFVPMQCLIEVRDKYSDFEKENFIRNSSYVVNRASGTSILISEVIDGTRVNTVLTIRVNSNGTFSVSK